MQNDIAVIAFDDYADGQAYMTDNAHVELLTDGFKAACNFLKAHDHVCILPDKAVKLCKSLVFTQVAPYSLILEAGSDFLIERYLEKFVNKL